MPDLSIVDEICRFVATGISDKSPSQLMSALLCALSTGYSRFQLYSISRAFLVFHEKKLGTDMNSNSLMVALAIKFPCYCSAYWGTLMHIGEFSTKLVLPLISQLLSPDASSWMFSYLLYTHCSKFDAFRKEVQMFLNSNDAVVLEVSNYISTSKAITSVKYWMDTSDILHLANFDQFCNFPFNNNSFAIGTKNIELDILCNTVGISDWTHCYAEIANSTSMQNEIIICWVLLENVPRCMFFEVSEVAILSVDDSMALSCNGYLNIDWKPEFGVNNECPLTLKAISEEETNALYLQLEKHDKLEVVKCLETFSVDCSSNLQPIISHKTQLVKEVSKSPELNPFLNQSFENNETQISAMVTHRQDIISSSPFIKSTLDGSKGVINLETAQLTQTTRAKKGSNGSNSLLRDEGSINNRVHIANKNHQSINDSSPTPKPNARNARAVLAKQNRSSSSRTDPKLYSGVKFSIGNEAATQNYEENTENDSYSMISPIRRLPTLPATINEMPKLNTAHDPNQNTVFSNEGIGQKSSLLNERICLDSSQLNRANLKKRRKFTLPTSSISEFWENDLTASTTLVTSVGAGAGEMGNEQRAIFEGFNSISTGIIRKLKSLDEQLKASELLLNNEINSKFQKLRSDHNESVKSLVKKMSEFAKQMD